MMEPALQISGGRTFWQRNSTGPDVEARESLLPFWCESGLLNSAGTGFFVHLLSHLPLGSFLRITALYVLKSTSRLISSKFFLADNCHRLWFSKVGKSWKQISVKFQNCCCHMPLHFLLTATKRGNPKLNGREAAENLEGTNLLGCQSQMVSRPSKSR